MGINVSRRCYTTWLRRNMNIFSNFSPDKWRHLRPQILRLQVQVFTVALVTRGVSDGQSGGNQKRSRLEQGGKSVGRESEVWRQWILQSSSASDTGRPAAIHQIVSEVLDARIFWRTNFICLKSKRKDIWPICEWLRFRIQPNSIDIATNCIRQKGKKSTDSNNVVLCWRRVYDDEIIPRL